MMKRKVTVEVCVDSVESAVEAQNGGAARVELCDNLMDGGTTPSAGAIETARKLLDIKLHVIIRPRGGDFLYSDVEFEVIKRDIDTAKTLGVDGVVIGLLDENGDVDVNRTGELVAMAQPLSVTFHRAFDVSRDAFQSLDDLISLAVDRVLTSGHEATAVEGTELISQLVQRAGDRIVVMACGNLNERNIAKVIAATNVQEVHITGFREVASQMKYRNERVFMGGTLRPPEYTRSVIQAEAIRETIRHIGN
jgi:copper homeostasis protein